ncbi:hypothetical protein PSACC_02207 [Paramicrosporidium saccamoebae]|uniref:Uncharacterized protein n=1 Tax=Paramicrosporidium saccamoebae TaxID=1246581 RepID=A0A2H9TJI2_9FUNG|nr:hypothetical protein PSACC_02207 [Paramicrosporidium saccamoebae]
MKAWNWLCPAVAVIVTTTPRDLYSGSARIPRTLFSSFEIEPNSSVLKLLRFPDFDFKSYYDGICESRLRGQQLLENTEEQDRQYFFGAKKMRRNYRLLKSIFLHGAFVPEYPVANSKFAVHSLELCVAVAKFLAGRKETIESFAWLKHCYGFPDDGRRADLTVAIQPLIDMTLIQEAYNSQYLCHLKLKDSSLSEDSIAWATLSALKQNVLVNDVELQRLVKRNNPEEQICSLRTLAVQYSKDRLLDLFELALLVSVPSRSIGEIFAGQLQNVNIYPFRAIKLYERAGSALVMQVGLFAELMEKLPVSCIPYELLPSSQLLSGYRRRMMYMRRDEKLQYLRIQNVLPSDMTLQQLFMTLENAFANFGPSHILSRVVSNSWLLFDDGLSVSVARLATIYANLALKEDWLFHEGRIPANDAFLARWRVLLSCIPHLLAHGYRLDFSLILKKTPNLSSCNFIKSLEVEEGGSKMWSTRLFTEKLVKYCQKLHLASFSIDHLWLLLTAGQKVNNILGEDVSG